jgi:hypothetical protein
MADLAATDITVTVLSRSEGDKNGRYLNLQLAFGDGALTYPSGGVPISKAALGCPNVIDSLVVYDKGTSGYEWSYDRANEKLVALYQASQTATAAAQVITVAAHSHTLNLKNAAVADSADARVNAGSNLLGANTGSDITIAGNGANGGIANTTATATAATSSVPVAAGVLAQPSTVAIAAQTLKVRVIGY